MNLILDQWTKKDYSEFINLLKSKQDIGYKKFHEKLVPGKDNIIGIRSPISKGISKEISKGNWRSFLQLSGTDYYEEIFIKGQVIGLAKTTYEELISLVDGYLPLIDNWAICDSFSGSLKQSRKYELDFFQHIRQFLFSEQSWTIRTGLIIMLSHYLKENYIDDVIKLCDLVNSSDYYVNMGQAWLISICYIKFPEITGYYLENNSTLDKWTYNKSITKITESLRIDSETKKYLKTLKKP